MNDLLLTGFSPFEGRTVNASWVAARRLAESRGAEALELPVIWGRAARLLMARCRRQCPEVIVALGEGRPGWFDIETRARKAPRPRLDNEDRLPGEHPWPDGPAYVPASVDAGGLQQRLYYRGFPARLSTDAGGFICEQTFYTLEMLKRQPNHLTTVVFVHVPPWQSPLRVGDREVTCGESTLAAFGESLLEAVTVLHRHDRQAG